MPITTSLLCTFTTPDALDSTLKKIIKAYTITFDAIYILESIEDTDILCVTYNIDSTAPIVGSIPDNTISLHRKKSTKTLYSINALNLLIASLNNGKLDRTFQIPWENYENTILVSAKSHLQQIHTKLLKIVKVSEMSP